MNPITIVHLKKLISASKIKISGMYKMRKSELACVYVEKTKISGEEIIRFVNILSILDLVTFYIELPQNCVLRRVVRDRLSRLGRRDWDNILHYDCASLKFLEEFAVHVNWGIVSKIFSLSANDIERLQNILNFKIMSSYQKLSEETILKFSIRWDWYAICKYQILSEQCILKSLHLICPYVTVKYQSLTENTINNILYLIPVETKVLWRYIVECQSLSHEFLLEHIATIYNMYFLYGFILFQNLQDRTILFLGEKLTQDSSLPEADRRELFQVLVLTQEVSEDFCEKYAHFIDWTRLIKEKRVPLTFLDRFKYFIDWKVAIVHQHIPDDYIKTLPKPYHHCVGDMKDSCSVCLEEVMEEAVVTNPCSHRFCRKCIDRCLLVNSRCPLCRHGLISLDDQTNISHQT